MRKRITRIGVHQTAWTMALWYLFILAIAWVIVLIVALVQRQDLQQVMWGLVGVVVYAIVGYIAWVVIAWIYNAIAKVTGGVEFTVKSVPEPKD